MYEGEHKDVLHFVLKKIKRVYFLAFELYN